MAIVVLVLWTATAVAGAVLLFSGNAARRAAAAEPGPPQVPEPAPSPVPSPGPAPVGSGAPAPAPAAGRAAGARVAAPGPAAAHPGVPGTTATVPALPPAGPGEPRPIPRVSVHAAPGEHPLLEFSHPALGLLGLGCWFIYVGTSHVALAWVSFGVLAAATAAGLFWLARSARARSAGQASAGPAGAPSRFPPRLALAHGLLAGSTVVLAILTALTAAR
jgi:hypothetical protein